MGGGEGDSSLARSVVPYVRVFLRYSSPYLYEFRKINTENSERLSWQVRPGFESGTSCLSAWNTEPLPIMKRNKTIIAETSVRPYIRLEKFLMFAFLSVCVSRDSDRKNYPIRFKFGTNVYLLYEISCIVFDLYCPNSACTGLCKKISITGYWRILHFGPMKKNVFVFFLSVWGTTGVAEIIRFIWDLAQMFIVTRN